MRKKINNKQNNCKLFKILNKINSSNKSNNNKKKLNRLFLKIMI